jgi:hypothetical protein
VSVDSQAFLTCSSVTPDGLLLEKSEEQAVNDRVAAKSALRVLCGLMTPE